MVSSNNSDNDMEQTRIDAKILHNEYPTMTYSECIRFRKLRNINKARKKLKGYLDWQKKYNLLDDDFLHFQQNKLSKLTDKEIWEYAVNHALQFFPQVELSNISVLPRISRIIDIDSITGGGGATATTTAGTSSTNTSSTSTDSDNSGSQDDEVQEQTQEQENGSEIKKNRVCYFLPMLLDTSIAPYDFYSLCFGVYFYLSLDRNGLEKIKGVCDARYGKGWANPSPLGFLPFAKCTAKHMDWFPQRLDQSYSFPVPLAAKIGWSILKTFLNPVSVAKMHIHWGSTSIDASPPKCFTDDYFGKAVMDAMEKQRRSEFH